MLSDSPVTPSLNMRAYNHYLGGCDVSWMAAPALANSLRAGFPKSLDGAPLLLPTSDTAIRRALDQWLDQHGVRPLIAGEFEDYALLREFARAGRGVAPVPSVLVKQLRQESGSARARRRAQSSRRVLCHLDGAEHQAPGRARPLQAGRVGLRDYGASTSMTWATRTDAYSAATKCTRRRNTAR